MLFFFLSKPPRPRPFLTVRNSLVGNPKTLKLRRPKRVELRVFLVCHYWTFFFFSKKINSVIRRMLARFKRSQRKSRFVVPTSFPLLFQKRTRVTRFFYLLLNLYRSSMGRQSSDELEKLSFGEPKRKPPLFRWFSLLAKRRQERRALLRHQNKLLFFPSFCADEVYDIHVVKISNQLEMLQEGVRITGLETKHSQVKNFPGVYLWRHIEMNRNINASVLLPIPHLVLLAQYVDYRFFWKSLLIEQFSYFRYLQR